MTLVVAGPTTTKLASAVKKAPESGVATLHRLVGSSTPVTPLRVGKDAGAG